MPYDDEELRREALMRMAMPEMDMETVDFRQEPMRRKKFLDLGPVTTPEEDEARRREAWESGGGPTAPGPGSPKKDILDKIYGALPDAPGLKAATDPLLKRKGLGR